MTLTLSPSDRIPRPPGPVVLAVMDGIGLGRGDEGDAVSLARTPTLDWLGAHAAFRSILAHGTAVGLPSDEDMGNSEVGHNAMGAGRVYAQGAKLVREAIADGSVFEADTWKQIVEHCRGNGSALHLIGLLSDGNVHSHEAHLHRILQQADREGLERVYVHPLLDGRDVPETSALEYVERLEGVLGEIAVKDGRDYRVASGGGRMTTTMDRYEADWRIVERGWNAHVHGEARRFPSAKAAIEAFREETPGIIDQDLPAFVVEADGAPVAPMRDGDAVIFFNFRGDRALEITRAFEAGDDFDAFDRGRRPAVLYAGMTLYDGEYGIPGTYLVPPPSIRETMGEYLAGSGVTQFAISETQKYGHITYFWNGNRGGMFDERTESYVEIPSDRVSFDERPWMKAAEITDTVIERLAEGKDRFLRLNWANGDMVGHTGKLTSTVIAVESVDLCLGRLLKAVRRVEGTLVVTADHGNADDMFERDKQGSAKRHADGRPRARTSHSLNPVGLWIWRPGDEKLPLRGDLPAAGLANLAPTLLELLGFAPPEGYEPSLLA